MGTKDFRPSELPVAIGPDETRSPSDASARAIARGRECVVQDLLDAGGTYDLNEVLSVLRPMSLEELNRLVEEGAILAVPGPNNKPRFPKMQFNPDGTIIQGLRAVSEAFPSRSPSALINFLVNPQTDLGGAKPIDRVRAGAVAEVVSIALRIGDQGS